MLSNSLSALFPPTQVLVTNQSQNYENLVELTQVLPASANSKSSSSSSPSPIVIFQLI